MYGIYFLCYKQTVQDVMQFLYNVVVTNVLIGLYITFYIKMQLLSLYPHSLHWIFGGKVKSVNGL